MTHPRDTRAALAGGMLLGTVLAAGLSQARPAHSSTPAQEAGAGRSDTIRGVVFDSLLNEPLAGAFVTAAPSGATATTDSLGRFTLLGDGRVESLTAYHPVLDQTGLGALVAVRPANRDRWSEARLATPSLTTLWPKLCNSRRPRGVRSVIVTGTARLSDNRTRVAGAKVLVQWAPNVRTGPDPYVTVETLTDSLGNYVMCDVEEFADLSLLALSTEAQSGVIHIPSELYPLRRADLVLARTEGSDRRITLGGRVLDQARAPLANVHVSIDGRDSAVTTDADGRFTLDSVPLGSRMLSVRAIGYTPVAQVVEVLETDNPALTIPVERAVELEGVRVTERAIVRRERSEFDLRRSAGIGRFIDSTEIARAPNLRAALSVIRGRGLQVTNTGNTSEFTIIQRSQSLHRSRVCQATVFWDGVLATMDDVNRIPKEDLVAVEYYTTTALAPARYIVVAKDDCAVVLFWTKHGLRP